MKVLSSKQIKKASCDEIRKFKEQYIVKIIGSKDGKEIRWSENWRGKTKGDHDLIHRLVQKQLIGKGITPVLVTVIYV